MRTPVYMDYHSTTPIDARVVDVMLPFFTEKFGNAASRQHMFGWIAEEAVESSRARIAQQIGAEQKDIVFTSGATESNNLAIKGLAEARRQKGNHIITVQTEHKSVLDACRRLEKQGFEVTYLPVDSFGVVDVNRLRDSFRPKTVLVSVMFANNEIGTLQPIAEIGRVCRENGIIFHTDATQAVGKVPVNVSAMCIDAMSFSGHKIYGPKGVGALYARQSGPKVKIAMQMDGGGHERGMRSGTLNVPGIVGMAKAVELSVELMAEESKRLSGFRDRMLREFVSHFDGVSLNGHPTDRLPHNLNVSFAFVEDNALLMSMKDIAVSTGSACSTADPEPSHVLKALRLPEERLHSSVRFGLGRFTTEEEVEYVITRVVEGVRKLRELSPAYQTLVKKQRQTVTV